MKLTGLIVLCVLTLSGCATQPGHWAADPPGFLLGLCHGLVFVPAVITGFFNEVRIYAFPNSGHWYDVGYAIGALFGAPLGAFALAVMFKGS